jgi:AcrR family transcriptional regulator
VGNPKDASAPQGRQRDAERTREEILAVAMAEFARNGYSGARVDDIAARTRTTKRMIYYYFGGKEGLYIEVLERAYAGIRDHERSLDVGHLTPSDAVRRLVELTFDYDQSHPEFIKLVSVENIHEAEFLRKSVALRPMNNSAVELLDKLLAAGRSTGEFTTKISALELHLMITALCFFRVSNRASVTAIFGHDMGSPRSRARQRRLVADMVIAFLKGCDQ